MKIKAESGLKMLRLVEERCKVSATSDVNTSMQRARADHCWLRELAHVSEEEVSRQSGNKAESGDYSHSALGH